MRIKIAILALLAALAIATPVIAGGGKVRGDNAQGATEQFQLSEYPYAAHNHFGKR